MIWNVLAGGPKIIDTQTIEWLAKEKQDARINGDEQRANDIWRIEVIIDIWRMYLDAYEKLTLKKEHEDAWNLFAQIEIAISSLRKHFDLQGRYKIELIETSTREFQKLFPYRMFTSRESVIKESKCSICGKIRSLRRPCGHKKGELYFGEMCYRIITDVELLAIAMVKNPVDKYTVIHLADSSYDYKLLDSFIDQMDDPFMQWRVSKIPVKNPKFNNVGRNETCPCGSGIKYKKCCYLSGNDMMDHFQFSLPKDKVSPHLIGNRIVL